MLIIKLLLIQIDKKLLLDDIIYYLQLSLILNKYKGVLFHP